MELMAFALGAFATVLIGTVLVWVNDLIEGWLVRRKRRAESWFKLVPGRNYYIVWEYTPEGQRDHVSVEHERDGRVVGYGNADDDPDI
jgi:hypothetical protein